MTQIFTEAGELIPVNKPSKQLQTLFFKLKLLKQMVTTLSKLVSMTNAKTF